MARTEVCVLTNMCMICEGSRILVLDRKDPDWPGITFPGGHVEPRESFVDAVKREVREETGLRIADVRLCGIKQFTHSEGKYRYIVLLYRTDRFSGELESSGEGNVFWIEREDLQNYALADGFEAMMEIFENEDLSENFWWREDGEWKTENR